MEIKAKELAVLLGAILEGNPDAKVSKLAKIEEADTDSFCFLANPKYYHYAQTAHVGILLCDETLDYNRDNIQAALRVPEPYVAFQKLMELYAAMNNNSSSAGIDANTHIGKGSTYGSNLYLGAFAYVGANVKLGNNVKVQNNVSVYEGVVCEDDVFLGPSMVFTNILIPRSAVVRKGQYTETLVRKGASIGANATIVCGNEIGAYAMIGAGAVVTKTVKPYALMLGNPARQAGWVSEYGHRLNFDEHNKAVCPESGQQYTLTNEQVQRIA